VTSQTAEVFPGQSDPFSLFESWYGEAEVGEPSDPNAMSLATVDKAGLPNVRTVLLKGLDAAEADPRGFVFYTNLESAKGSELRSAQKAALLFYWKSTGKQVRVRGAVSVVPDAEADAYFASRPRGSQLGAWASLQSRPLADRETLEAGVRELEAKYEGQDVPRPPHWSGFRLLPLEMEFWRNGEFRLHDRVLLTRTDPGSPWEARRLYP